jgi:hypothetical protein
MVRRTGLQWDEVVLSMFVEPNGRMEPGVDYTLAYDRLTRALYRSAPRAWWVP